MTAIRPNAWPQTSESRLRDHPELLPYFPEGRQRLVDVRIGMCRAQLHPDTRGVLRHHREEEADHVDAFFQQFVCHHLAQLRITEHHGDDRAAIPTRLETERFDTGLEALH